MARAEAVVPWGSPVHAADVAKLKEVSCRVAKLRRKTSTP